MLQLTKNQLNIQDPVITKANLSNYLSSITDFSHILRLRLCMTLCSN